MAETTQNLQNRWEESNLTEKVWIIEEISKSRVIIMFDPKSEKGKAWGLGTKTHNKELHTFDDDFERMLDNYFWSYIREEEGYGVQ